jgi:hypothetical protein
MRCINLISLAWRWPSLKVKASDTRNPLISPHHRPFRANDRGRVSFTLHAALMNLASSRVSFATCDGNLDRRCCWSNESNSLAGPRAPVMLVYFHCPCWQLYIPRCCFTFLLMSLGSHHWGTLLHGTSSLKVDTWVYFYISYCRNPYHLRYYTCSYSALSSNLERGLLGASNMDMKEVE